MHHKFAKAELNLNGLGAAQTKWAVLLIKKAKKTRRISEH